MYCCSKKISPIADFKFKVQGKVFPFLYCSRTESVQNFHCQDSLGSFFIKYLVFICCTPIQLPPTTPSFSFPFRQLLSFPHSPQVSFPHSPQVYFSPSPFSSFIPSPFPFSPFQPQPLCPEPVQCTLFC